MNAKVLQCDCDFHRGDEIMGVIDVAVPACNWSEADAEMLKKNPLAVEVYPSELWVDGDTIFTLRNRVGALRAKVFYQDFSKNLMGHHDDAELVADLETATFITEFIYNPLHEARIPYLDKIYRYMNNLCVPVGHPDRPTFERAGHTSMSIGDLVLFQKCCREGDPDDPDRAWSELWICASTGWRVVSC